MVANDLGRLVAAMVAFGTATLVGDAASQSFLPRVVPRPLLGAAHARIDQADAVAQGSGPAVAGVVVSLLGAASAVLVTSDVANDAPHLPVHEHHAEMDSRVAEAPSRRPVSLVTVLGVVLLLFAVGMGAGVVWQLSAGGRAPAAFRERSALPRCAPITVPQGQPRSTALQDCLLSAGAHREGAEVLLTSLTTEGDAIRTYYRVLPGEGVEVFTDATEDSFGSGEWSHDRCPDVAALESGEGRRPA